MATQISSPDQGTPIHILIAQASGLAHEMARARRGDLERLRERAQDLVRTLDSQHPTQSAMQQALALVRDLAKSGSADIEGFHQRAQQLPDALTTGAGRPRQRMLPTSTRDVDAWILEMFRATESAIPRESLVEDFIVRYRRERRVQDTEHHLGPWLFEFQAERAQGDRIVSVAPLVGAGLHLHAFQQHCRVHLPQWETDPFLGPVIGDQGDIDGWYALPFGGSPLFDALLDIRRHMDGEPDYWINGVALPGDGRHETRAVFTLYRNVGDPLYPEPPSVMRQDMRLLTVLALAWRQLEHQVRALARLSETDRRDMINLIAPGLLHHEIGYSMRTAYGQAYEQLNLLKGIAAQTGHQDIGKAIRYAYGIGELVLRLYRITDAFNNLDKRAQVEDSDLARVFSELKLLLHNRLGHASTEFTWDSFAFKAEIIHTDVVLLAQVLINIVNNALNALTEADTIPPRRIRVELTHTDSNRLTLIIVNNGPAIPRHEVQSIFLRGYTTRRQGHGQGLYLARLVAHYLGGELTLMESAAMPEGFNVGFRLTFNRRIPAEQGVSRETS